MQQETNTLGEIIYNLRKKAGLTQEELAEGICSAISVSRIENGRQMPSGRILEQLLERLGTGTYQLCNVYYENEYQQSLNQSLSDINAYIKSGDFTSARKALDELASEKLDPANLQLASVLEATIDMKTDFANSNAEIKLTDALRLTKSDINLYDCRGELFSPAEINILVLLVTAKYMAGENIEAIRIGEEVMFALEKNQSRLSDYEVLRINLAHNLAAILKKESRFKEALSYEKKAEELSIQGTEQFMLPEIELGIAEILNDMGDAAQSRARIEALIPYMRLIGKTQAADLAQEYLEKNLTNDVS